MNTKSASVQKPSLHFQLLGKLVDRVETSPRAPLMVERLIKGMHDRGVALDELVESWTMVRHNPQWREAWVDGATKFHALKHA